MPLKTPLLSSINPVMNSVNSQLSFIKHAFPMLFRFILLAPILYISACEDGPDLNHKDPSDLVVEVSIVEEKVGNVTIVATANHAIEYQLRISSDEQNMQRNTSGVFHYTFTQTGIYQIEIRAYGESGRFIRETLSLPITIEGDTVMPEDGFVSPITYDGYQLIWHDEFDNQSISSENWVFETGTGCPHLCGWGNNELQYYRQQNAWTDEGILVIEARQESFSGSNYTSARMKTQGKQSFKYGRIDIRALLPQGKGIWPALWMLGDNITSVGWPACGEIDIMEMIGGNGRENQVHGTLHWDNDGHVSEGRGYTLPTGTFSDEYHVFSIIWDETSIRWFVNNSQFHEISITSEHMTEFHQNFFLIFNVAVGGYWPGNPDQTTTFPQQMKVDYVRVFQKE